MTSLPDSVTDADLIALVDHWAALLEREDYSAAYNATEHDFYEGWTPDLIRQVIKSYGDARVNQRVTVGGVPTDISQRKEVTRWPENKHGVLGEMWYDLNIDGVISDLTATFDIVRAPGGLLVRLCDIHVM